jgi:hypothetical protein
MKAKRKWWLIFPVLALALLLPKIDQDLLEGIVGTFVTGRFANEFGFGAQAITLLAAAIAWLNVRPTRAGAFKISFSLLFGLALCVFGLVLRADHKPPPLGYESWGEVIFVGTLLTFAFAGSALLIHAFPANVATLDRDPIPLATGTGQRERIERHDAVVGLQEECKMDPISMMTAITSGLALLDKFVDLVRKLPADTNGGHRVEAKQEQGSFIIRHNGQVVKTVSAKQLHLDEWDSVRFSTLQRRVSLLWNQYNSLYGELPNLSVDEKVRIKAQMEKMRQELCNDFREMVSMSERVLGVELKEHYTLNSTCDDVLS